MKTSVLLFTLAGLLAASAVTVTTWPAVRTDRPTFYTWNGTSVDIRDVTWDR